MTDDIEGRIPGGTNPDFIYLTGAILSWWARIEGIMVNDIMVLRTQSFSKAISEKEKFPKQGKTIITHWRKLILNGYRTFKLAPPNLDTIVNNSIQCLDCRNNLAHSFWPYGQDDEKRLNLQWVKPNPNAKYGVDRGEVAYSVQELDRVNSKLSSLYTHVMTASFRSHILYKQQGSD